MASEFVKVCSTADVPPGSIKSVEADGTRIALCNVGGEFYAVRDECTHEQFPLSEGDLDDERLTCMLHGACFDVKTGDVLALPATDAVQVFDVRVQGDDIEVAVG